MKRKLQELISAFGLLNEVNPLPEPRLDCAPIESEIKFSFFSYILSIAQQEMVLILPYINGWGSLYDIPDPFQTMFFLDNSSPANLFSGHVHSMKRNREGACLQGPPAGVEGGDSDECRGEDDKYQRSLHQGGSAEDT